MSSEPIITVPEIFDLSLCIRAGTPPVVEVRGEIDIWSGPPLRDQLLRVVREHGATLALDLGGVTFLDCAGINALLATRRRADLEGGSLCVVRASPCVLRVFALAGVQQVLMQAVQPGRTHCPRDQ